MTERTPRPDRPRTKISPTLMVAIVSFTLGYALRPSIPWWIIATPASIGFGTICCYLATRALLAIAFGERCPSCDQPTMERRAVVGFGDRFYACSACGDRRRRKALGPWRDASGPGFASYYTATPEADPWTMPPDLDDGPAILSKNHMLLVRNKRRRHPNDPNGPGLPP